MKRRRQSYTMVPISYYYYHMVLLLLRRRPATITTNVVPCCSSLLFPLHTLRHWLLLALLAGLRRLLLTRLRRHRRLTPGRRISTTILRRGGGITTTSICRKLRGGVTNSSRTLRGGGTTSWTLRGGCTTSSWTLRGGGTASWTTCHTEHAVVGNLPADRSFDPFIYIADAYKNVGIAYCLANSSLRLDSYYNDEIEGRDRDMIGTRTTTKDDKVFILTFSPITSNAYLNTFSRVSQRYYWSSCDDEIHEIKKSKLFILLEQT